MARVGIYLIKNTKSGKCYVGSAIDVDRRWIEHRKALRGTRHHCAYLQRSWVKHGEGAFVFEFVEPVAKAEHLVAVEQTYIDYYRHRGIAYNINVTAGSRLGMKHTQETLAKMGAVHRGRPMHPNTREALKQACTGRIKTPAEIEAIRTANLGKRLTAEHKAKLSESHKGIIQAPEQLEKNRLAHLGKKKSDETRANMKAAQQKAWTPERRAAWSVRRKELCAAKRAAASTANLPPVAPEADEVDGGHSESYERCAGDRPHGQG